MPRRSRTVGAKRPGAPKTPKKLWQQQRDNLIFLAYRNGATISEVAKRYGVSRSTAGEIVIEQEQLLGSTEGRQRAQDDYVARLGELEKEARAIGDQAKKQGDPDLHLRTVNSRISLAEKEFRAKTPPPDAEPPLDGQATGPIMDIVYRASRNAEEPSPVWTQFAGVDPIKGPFKKNALGMREFSVTPDGFNRYKLIGTDAKGTHHLGFNNETGYNFVTGKIVEGEPETLN